MIYIIFFSLCLLQSELIMISLAILKGRAGKKLRDSLIQPPCFTCGSTSVRKTNWLTQGQEGVVWLSSDSDDDDDEERRRRRKNKRKRRRRKMHLV